MTEAAEDLYEHILNRLVSTGAIELRLARDKLFCSHSRTEGWPPYFSPYAFPSVREVLLNAREEMEMHGIELTRLTGLRHLSLVEYQSGTYHLCQAAALLRSLPNVEVLNLPDCGAETRQQLRQEWEGTSLILVPFPRLRKLSISGVSPWFLETIIRRSPVLEDLECYCSMDQEYPILTATQLQSQQHTLRRLSYSVTMEYMQEGNWPDEPSTLR